MDAMHVFIDGHGEPSERSASPHEEGGAGGRAASVGAHVVPWPEHSAWEQGNVVLHDGSRRRFLEQGARPPAPGPLHSPCPRAHKALFTLQISRPKRVPQANLS